MARKERNNVDYFPYLCNEGTKMFYLEETYGNDGFATLVKLLIELAKTEYHYLNLSKKTTVMFLSAKCKVDKEVLLNIINDLVELGKFDEVLWSENRIIWCQDFIDNIQDAYRKRNNKCITKDELLDILIALGVRKSSKLRLKGDGNPHSIEENNKVKKTIVNNVLIFWNSQNIINHKECKEIEKTISQALKENSEEEIINSIKNYAEVLNSKYFFSYKWTLKDFLSREKGFKEFLINGEKWVNYMSWKVTKGTEKLSISKEEIEDILSGNFDKKVTEYFLEIFIKIMRPNSLKQCEYAASDLAKKSGRDVVSAIAIMKGRQNL